jgi:hypothetical protein
VLVSDMMEPGGRVFLKSEFCPIGDQWPCFSFTKKPVGRRLQSEFRPGRDIVVYVGTTNPETTEDPDHRSRILSALSIEPNHILETRMIVPFGRTQSPDMERIPGPIRWPLSTRP